MKIAIASDHAGFELKEALLSSLKTVEWTDCGPSAADRCDYPDYAAKVAALVRDKKIPLGVLICGSGIGMSIAANKIKGIRAAVVESEKTAILSKQHNDANILCLGARILSPESAKKILESWINATFEGGRHSGRIEKISSLEEKKND